MNLCVYCVYVCVRASVCVHECACACACACVCLCVHVCHLMIPCLLNEQGGAGWCRVGWCRMV